MVEFRLGGAKGPAIVSANPFTARVWHQLVCQWDGKAVRIFIDGAPAAEKECAGPYIGIARNESWSQAFPELDVGGFHFGGKPANERFDVDEVAIFSRALTADEIRTHYEAGRPATSAEEQTVAFGKLQERRKALDAITMRIPIDTEGIFRVGTKIPATIAIPANAGWQGEYVGHFLLRDVRNMTIAEETRKLSATTDRGAEAICELAPPLCGIYFLDMWLTDAAGAVVKRLPEEYCLAITVPLPPADKIPLSSPLQAHNISGAYSENRFLGFGVDRWIKGSEAYKKVGEIDPKTFGAEMDFEKQSGLKVMFCLHMGMPAWAERAPGKKFLLKDMSIWADYCRQMFRQYKDMVAYWELENEPNAGDLIPADEYVEFLKIGYRTIKAEDPNAVVLGLCGCPGFLNWNEKVFTAGGAKDFDVLSLHNYNAYPIKTRTQERQIERAIEQLVKFRGERVPVWNSETGFHPAARVNGRPVTADVLTRQYARVQQSPGQPPFLPADMPVLTERDTAAWQVQSALLDLGDGCQKFFILSGVSHYHPDMNSCNGQPSEMAPAIAALQSLLIPSTSVEKFPLSSSSDAAVIITQQDGRRVAALFPDETPTLSFKVGDRTTMAGMDMMGNPLKWDVAPGGILTVQAGREPVYILDVPKDFAQVQFMKVANAPANLPEDGQMEGDLVVTNQSSKDLSATIKPIPPLPGTTLTVSDEKMSLAPGESKSMRFKLDGRTLGRRIYDLGFVLFDGNAQLGKLNYAFNSEGCVRKVTEAAASAKIGDGQWWKSIEPETCDEEAKVVHGKPIVGVPWAPQWRGPKDLSFTLRTAWTHDGALLLRLDATDDVLMPAPKEKRGVAFQYDCMELFFDGRAVAERKGVVTPGVEQILVIPNATAEGGPCDFWFGRSGGKEPSVQVEFIGGKSATGYWIEGALRPAPAAAFRVRAGSQFAFDVLLDDTDSEKELRKEAMALHGVFNNNGEPDKWGRYQLEPAAKGK